MKRRIYKLLEGLAKNVRKSRLKEAVKIRKSTPMPHAGYFLFITSDSTDSNVSSSEAAKMGKTLNLTGAQVKRGEFRKPFNPPKYYKNRETGQFGWGYLITPNLSNEQINVLLSNLKELVRDYNVSEKLEDDTETGNLTVQEVQFLQQLVAGLEEASDKQMNPETKANLERHLDALEKAIEDDSVYEFLIDKYEKAKNFKESNSKIANHNYSILNSLIITFSDPEAILAGPKDYWEGRNYKIKDGASGVSISMPDTKGISANASLVKSRGMWDQYKREKGLPPSETFDNYVKRKDGQSNRYALSLYAIKNKLTSGFGFKYAPVFTDTMVEPMPGKEVEPIVGDEDLFHVKQSDIESEEGKKTLVKLSKALERYAEVKKLPTTGFDSSAANINSFNRILNIIALDAIRNRFRNKEKESGGVELLKGFAEVVSAIIKKHYGLPSEESKYNIARRGVDREELKKESEGILKLSDDIIKLIDKNMSELTSGETHALNEVRKIVRNILRENI